MFASYVKKVESMSKQVTVKVITSEEIMKPDKNTMLNMLEPDQIFELICKETDYQK